jgi:hypothetical protein
MVNYIFVGNYNNDGKSSLINYDPNGPPANNNLYFNVANDISTDITNKLPESVSLPLTHPEWIKNGDIHLIQSANINLVFFDEGANYKNSIGYYFYNDNHIITTIDDINNIYILFPNSSKTGSGGTLNRGDTIALPSAFTVNNIDGKLIGTPTSYLFSSHTKVGFILFADGWDSNNKTVNFDVNRCFSNPNLNVEPLQHQRYHTINIQSSVETELVILGFEDLPRNLNSDNDFNDVVLLIDCNPFSAISPESINIVTGIGGDPHIKQIDGSIYHIPNDWSLINLLTCSNTYSKIIIDGSCRTLSSEEFLSVHKFNKHGSGRKRKVNLNKEKYYLENTYFDKLIIRKNKEYVILDTINLKIIESNKTTIKLNKVKPNNGIFSYTYNKHYPITKNTKQANIIVDDIVIMVKTDNYWDEINEVSFQIGSLTKYKHVSGALINDSPNNRLDF